MQRLRNEYRHSFTNLAGRFGNQAGQQNIHGDQIIYVNRRGSSTDRPERRLTSTSREPSLNRPYVSVPISTVPTYTARHELSSQLEEKLSKPREGNGPAHAVFLVGLGGTGKTQLALDYVEKHQSEYAVVLWIDAQSQETARSSFVRCCNILHILADAGSWDGPVAESAAAQSVLQCLLKLRSDQKWLVVIDNVDDLSWHPGTIIPRGAAGSVIVTCQDQHTTRILGSREEVVRVDRMQPEEAVDLFLNTVCRDTEEARAKLDKLARQTVDYLDGLAFAVNLAGARVREDVEDDGEAESAIEQLNKDLGRHYDDLLHNEEFNEADTYNKTFWTVWQTSISCVRRHEEAAQAKQSPIYPLKLLALLTRLDRTNIQDSFFRRASVGLPTACKETNITPPEWLQEMLKGEFDEQNTWQWDDFVYRESMKHLRSHGLVRQVKAGSFPGHTMHRLVQWRASQVGDSSEMWQSYTALVVAACACPTMTNNVLPSRHLISHLPTLSSLRRDLDHSLGKLELNVFTFIATVWASEGRWEEAEKLLQHAVDLGQRKFGDDHEDVLRAIHELARSFQGRGKYSRAERLLEQAIPTMREVIGETHIHTLSAIGDLAMARQHQERYDDAERLQLIVLELMEKHHPDKDRPTTFARRDLARTYLLRGKLQEAEELQSKTVEMMRTFGEKHVETLICTSDLATIYQHLGKHDEARHLQWRIAQLLADGLEGDALEDIFTLSNMSRGYQTQGRLKEAQSLQSHALLLVEEKYGKEHPYTIDQAANLAEIHRMRRHHSEADRLLERYKCEEEEPKDGSASGSDRDRRADSPMLNQEAASSNAADSMEAELGPQQEQEKKQDQDVNFQGNGHEPINEDELQRGRVLEPESEGHEDSPKRRSTF